MNETDKSFAEAFEMGRVHFHGFEKTNEAQKFVVELTCDLGDFGEVSVMSERHESITVSLKEVLEKMAKRRALVEGNPDE